jgi:hypothetical protein
LEIREVIHVPALGLASQAFLEMKAHNCRLYDCGVISDLLDEGVHILPVHRIAFVADLVLHVGVEESNISRLPGRTESSVLPFAISRRSIAGDFLGAGTDSSEAPV